MTFQKGQSGNPAGRPLGSRNKRTILLEKLFDEEAEELTMKAIRMAKSGNLTALRLCMERISAPMKARRVAVDLPSITTRADAVAAIDAVFEAVAAGELTASEAGEFVKIVQTAAQTATNMDREMRITGSDRSGGASE